MTKFDSGRTIAGQCSSGQLLEPIERVRAAILAQAEPVDGTERVPAGAALGRVVARGVDSSVNVPPFDNSAVDGYGVGEEALGRPAPQYLRLTGSAFAGGPLAGSLAIGEAIRVTTGAAIPKEVRAVAAEEHCARTEGGVTLLRSLADGLNIRRAGEDIVAGATVIEAGQVVDARHCAVLAGIGCRELTVRRRLRVGVLSNGNELVEAGGHCGPGKICDVNRPMLLALVARPWIEPVDLGIAGDDARELAALLQAAAKRVDIVLISGGVFGSDADCVAAALALNGGVVRQHQVAMKPGKRLLSGRIGAMTVLALPGNPLAALVGFILFGRPLLAALAGASPEGQPDSEAIAAGAFIHAPGRTEFVPSRIAGRSGCGRLLVEGAGRGGAVHLSPLASADGLVELPAQEGDLAPGAVLRFHPFGQGCL